MTPTDWTQLWTEFTASKDFLIALGDEKRQQIIIALLHQESSEGLRVGDFLKITHLSRPAVSHHLKVLKDAGVLIVRSEGTRNYYQLAMRTPLEGLVQLCQTVLTTLDLKEAAQ
ncbi:ArsR/SmtB family transcription factor [Secundilactobacillus kimchicus]|uniref:HTH arsR-type domain-containing protein n=1 Tax=Secundilactobacillus kimchicus JCM 15530 TaxID=1302272 RepID=A0A0R1HYJ9_9LACO|nr:metalloregulator ArsR/SmtB family transcription factor [Secundilactobacillus kimchicus]KRK48522.1 hypothetical protein FC96_GL001633 [Secundilactobacillus kimchicus JCM 15530]MBT9671268.1 metalloregulator ArsR/SmtB family transcription factor [Secundilactobacillus kimchicus]